MAVPKLSFFDSNYWLTESQYWLSSSQYGKAEKTAEMARIRGHFADNDIAKAIVTHKLSHAYDWNIGNEKLLESKVCREVENVYYSYALAPDAWWTFDFDAYLKSAWRDGVRMFRVFPRTHFFYLNDAYMKKIFHRLSQARFPVMSSCLKSSITGNKYFDVDVLERVLGENEGMPFILETTLKQCMFSRYFFPLLDQFPNLFIEASGLILVDQIEGYVERYGARRLIFGTNTPNLPAQINTNRIILADIPEEDKEKIAFANMNAIVEGIEVG
jgi:predicted TIM-barrel fold metal-dependent hydrolase